MLLNVFLVVFSPNPETLSLHREERGGEKGVDCMEKLVPVDTVGWFYAHIDM